MSKRFANCSLDRLLHAGVKYASSTLMEVVLDGNTAHDEA